MRLIEEIDGDDEGPLTFVSSFWSWPVLVEKMEHANYLLELGIDEEVFEEMALGCNQCINEELSRALAKGLEIVIRQCDENPLELERDLLCPEAMVADFFWNQGIDWAHVVKFEATVRHVRDFIDFLRECKGGFKLL